MEWVVVVAIVALLVSVAIFLRQARASRCPHCGKWIRVAQRYCPHCGEDLD